MCFRLQIAVDRAWSAWNAKLSKNVRENSSVTYWLNLLQNLKIDEDIFLSLNPFDSIDEKKILNKVTFTHPYYDKLALEKQAELKKHQNVNNTLFWCLLNTYAPALV